MESLVFMVIFILFLIVFFSVPFILFSCVMIFEGVALSDGVIRFRVLDAVHVLDVVITFGFVKLP